jgi:hypothetical protein
VSTTTQQLSAAQSFLSYTRSRAAGVQATLRRFAVDEYVNSGLYESTSLVSGTNNSPFGAPDQNGVTAHQYATVVASDLLAQSQAARAGVKSALAHRDGVQKTLQQFELTLTSDNATENRSLVRLVADVETLQKAGACTTAVITTPTPTATPVAQTPTSPTSNPPATPSTTTTTTVAPTTTTTSSTTTTTTTTVGSSLGTPIGTTTTTVPASTTTSSTTTTTTTTAPAGSDSGGTTAPAPTANPGGLQVLQTCVTALAPSPNA